MKRFLLPIGVTALALMTGVGYSVAQPSERGRSNRTMDDTTLARSASTVALQAVDIPGPCDEAEHANDPACTSTTVAPQPATPLPTPTTVARVDDDDQAHVEDVRGPCDETEHANDPRCTGATAIRDDGADHDGEHADDGARHDHRGDDGAERGDDHGGGGGSGSNRGPG